MTSFTAEAFSYLGLGVVCVLCRIHVRIQQQRGIRNLTADDYLMIFVLVPYTTEIVLAYFVGSRYSGLANGGMTDEQRATLQPGSTEYSWRVSGSKIQIAGWCVYVSVLWFIKASLCAFYSRLTTRLVGYHVRIYFGYAMIAGTYITVLLVILCSCQPLHRFWQINPNPGNLCQPGQSKLYVFTVMILNVLTDLYLIGIPIPILWGTSLPLLKKLSLVVVFSGAFFVMAAGILRGTLILQNEVIGPRLGSKWAVRESFVAVIASNLPPMWGWFTAKLAPLLNSIHTSKDDEKPRALPEFYNNRGSHYLHYMRWRGDVASHARSSNRFSLAGSEPHSDPRARGDDNDNTADAGTQSQFTSNGVIRKHVVIEMSSTPAQNLNKWHAPIDTFYKSETP